MHGMLEVVSSILDATYLQVIMRKNISSFLSFSSFIPSFWANKTSLSCIALVAVGYIVRIRIASLLMMGGKYTFFSILFMQVMQYICMLIESPFISPYLLAILSWWVALPIITKVDDGGNICSLLEERNNEYN